MSSCLIEAHDFLKFTFICFVYPKFMGIGRDSEIAPTKPSALCRRELRFPIIADTYNFRMDTPIVVIIIIRYYKTSNLYANFETIKIPDIYPLKSICCTEMYNFCLKMHNMGHPKLESLYLPESQLSANFE